MYSLFLTEQNGVPTCYWMITIAYVAVGNTVVVAAATLVVDAVIGVVDDDDVVIILPKQMLNDDSNTILITAPSPYPSVLRYLLHVNN